MILLNNNKNSLRMNLSGSENEEISTFSPTKKRRIFINPALIEGVSGFLKNPNGTVSDLEDDRLLDEVIIYVVVKKIDGEHIFGYYHNDWLEDRTSKNPGISKGKIYGFSGPSNVVLEITFSNKAFL